MDEVGWESAHVVGHSMGGLIGQQLAIDAPGRVRSLACICSFSQGKDAARLTPAVLWMGIKTRLGSRRMRRDAFLRILYSSARLRTADFPELAAETAGLIGRDLADSPPILMKQLQACARHHLRPRLGELALIPTLVVSAEHDVIACPDYGRDLATAIPGAEFVLHPGMAHGNLLEQPAWLNERLLHHFGMDR
jgi:pimeloyl-ACP methyl ester carboxylesterase